MREMESVVACFEIVREGGSSPAGDGMVDLPRLVWSSESEGVRGIAEHLGALDDELVDVLVAVELRAEDRIFIQPEEIHEDLL
jgi:hypothetical protein